MSRLIVVLSILFGTCCIGCGGSNEIKLPSDQLTEEQKAQIKKDDAKVADEESQGAKRR